MPRAAHYHFCAFCSRVAGGKAWLDGTLETAIDPCTTTGWDTIRALIIQRFKPLPTEGVVITSFTAIPPVLQPETDPDLHAKWALVTELAKFRRLGPTTCPVCSFEWVNEDPGNPCPAHQLKRALDAEVPNGR